MGTKTTTKTNQQNAFTFDPQSMGRYQGWQGGLFPQLQSLFSNPYSSPFFNLNLQQQTKGASQVAGRNTQNALMNFNRSGIGGGSLGGGAYQSLLAGAGRYGSGLQYQGFMNAANQAQSDRWNAASLGSSLFQPLQTGGTSSGTQTQQTGGLGTWLPQLIGAGLGAATGGGFGALGGLFKGGGSAAQGNIGAIGQSAGTSGILGGSLGNTGGLGGMPAMGAFDALQPGGVGFLPSGFNPLVPGGGA